MTFIEHDWPLDYQSQLDYMEELLGLLQDVDLQSAVVGVYQATEPNAAELTAVWDNYVNNLLPIPVGARILWWDSSRGVLDQAYMPTNDIGETATSQTLRALFPKVRTLDIEVIFSEVAQDVDMATPLGPNPLPTTFSHIWGLTLLRTTLAATNAILYWRGQSSAASYYLEVVAFRGSLAAPTEARIDAITAWVQAAADYGPGDTSERNSYALSMVLFAGYQKADDYTFLEVRAAFTSAAPVAAVSRDLSVCFGIYNGPGPLTTVNVNTNAALLKRGSKVLLYGLK
jgi:hypothetical protein